MTSEDTEAFIRSILGDEALQPATLTVNEQNWRGWQRRGLKEGPLKESDIFAAQLKSKADNNLVAQFWQAFHKRNIRLWTNSEASLFAVPQMPVLEILKYEQVGTHNQWDREELAIKSVRNALTEIYSQCPFEILFACTADLNAVFLKPVTRRQAVTFAGLISSIAFETENEWLGDLASRGEIEVDENGIPQGSIQTLADCIQQKQRFHLYWD